MVEVPEQTFSNDKYLDESRLLNTGTSSEDSGTPFKKHMPSKIASHEGACSLRKEPLKSWSMQSIPGSTSSTGKWNKLITTIFFYISAVVMKVQEQFLRWRTWFRGKAFQVLALTTSPLTKISKILPQVSYQCNDVMSCHVFKLRIILNE